MARGPGSSLRFGAGFRLCLGGLALLAVLFLSAGLALAANSPPSAGGIYAGQTSQRLAIRAVVSVNGLEFQNGRIFFRLHGGCRALRFLSFPATPPPAISINAQGHFSFRGSFPPTAAFRYTSRVMFRGQFSNGGQVVRGSAKYKASNGLTSCTSGLITFKATRH